MSVRETQKHFIEGRAQQSLEPGEIF